MENGLIDRGNHTAEVHTDQEIIEIVRKSWEASILFAACRLGLFEKISQKPAGLGELARELHADPRGLEAIMDALVQMGLMKFSDCKYRCTGKGRLLADPGGGLRAYIAFHEPLQHGWRYLPDYVIGHRQPALEYNRSENEHVSETYACAMDALGAEAASELAAFLDLEGTERILDLGGGSGVYARAILNKCPTVRVDVWERPAVCQLMRDADDRTSWPEGLRFIEGNYLDCGFNSEYDFVLIANIVHNEGANENQQILSAAKCALKPGGVVVIVDYFKGASGKAAEGPVGFSAMLLLISKKGRIYEEAEVIQWLEGCSLEPYRKLTLSTGYEAIHARKT